MKTSTSILAAAAVRHGLAETSRAQHASQARAAAFRDYARLLGIACETGTPDAIAAAARAARTAHRKMVAEGSELPERDLMVLTYFEGLSPTPSRIDPAAVGAWLADFVERYPKPEPPAKVARHGLRALFGRKK